MRIKINCSAFEVEVLDRDDKRIYHVECEKYALDLDAVRGIEEFKRLIDDVNSVG